MDIKQTSMTEEEKAYATVEEAVENFYLNQPVNFTMLVTRGIIDYYRLIDTNSEGEEVDYGIIFPNHNLYLAEAKGSKTPKDFRLYWDDASETYCSYTEEKTKHGDDIMYETKLLHQLNIGQLLSAVVVSIGPDPCGEPRTAIYLKQVPCQFDHPIIQRK